MRPGSVPRLVVGLGIVVLFGTVATLVFRNAADAREREYLITQSRTAVTAIDATSLAALTGSEADLGKPEYVRLKETLMRIRTANPDVRFAYLLAAREPGADKLYFIADSEPSDSKDYSAPGDVYEDTTPSELAGYRTGTSFAEGPARDSWGEWISAMTPVKDPETGEVRALLGLDISTRLFHGRIRDAEQLPVFLTLLLGMLVLAFWLLTRRARRHARELSQEREIARVVLTDLPVGVIVVRYPSGEVILQNPQAWSMAENAGEQTRAADFKFVTAGGDPYPPEGVPLAITLATGQKAVKDDLYLARPGGNLRIRAESAPVRDVEDRITYVAMVLEERP